MLDTFLFALACLGFFSLIAFGVAFCAILVGSRSDERFYTNALYE